MSGEFNCDERMKLPAESLTGDKNLRWNMVELWYTAAEYCYDPGTVNPILGSLRIRLLPLRSCRKLWESLVQDSARMWSDFGSDDFRR